MCVCVCMLGVMLVLTHHRTEHSKNITDLRRGGLVCMCVFVHIHVGGVRGCNQL